MLEIGSNVRLKSDIEWLDAKINLRATRGVVATIVRVIGTALPEDRRSYNISFEAQGRLKKLGPWNTFDSRDLIEISSHDGSA